MIHATTALMLAARTMTPDEGASLQQAHELVGIVSGLVGVLMVTVVAAIVALMKRLNRMEDTLIEVRVRLDEHLEVERGRRPRR